MATTTPRTAQDFKFIKFDTSSFAARITLNYPPYNVLTVPLMIELAEAIESLNGRSNVKCIVLDSSQKTFSAGISVEDSRPERVFQTLEAFNRVFSAISDISKPLIVLVNGPAIGAGSELVAFGDMVIATNNARFAQPEVKMGVFPPFAAIMLPLVEVVITEVSFFQQIDEPKIAELVHYFDERGFDLFDIAALSGRTRDDRLKQGDFIFVRRDSALAADKAWRCGG